MYSNRFFYNSTTCDIEAYEDANAIYNDPEVDPSFMRAFKKAIAIWIPITAVLAVFVSCLFLVLFRRFPQAMINTAIAGSVFSGLAFSIACLAVGATPVGVILLVATVVSAAFHWILRSRIRMCAEVLSLAARGLRENMWLLPAAIGIKVAGLSVLVYSFSAFFSAINMGHAEKNWGASKLIALRPEFASCFDSSDQRVPCCNFATEPLGIVYACFSAVFISWTVALIMQIKLFTVADTTAQWYFSTSTAGNTFSSAAVGGVGGGQTSGSVRLALRHCLLSSFGSVAFAAAILGMLRSVRSLLGRCARHSTVCCVFSCITHPLLALLERFTRFTTIASAITGQPFMSATRNMFDTLRRNFLQTFCFWWVPDKVLQFASLLMSLSWGAVVFFATYLTNKKYDVVYKVSCATAAVAFVLMLFATSFVAGLLLDTVNTLYICYALDKDQRRVTHPEIHAIYAQVPGLTVENPDGAVVYGAPEPHPHEDDVPPVSSQASYVGPKGSAIFQRPNSLTSRPASPRLQPTRP